MNQDLLKVEDLKKYFPVKRRLFRTAAWVRALDGVSFTLKRARTLGLVGESGCGKTTLARTIARLIRPDAGRIFFEGRELTGLSSARVRPLRKNLQIVFQDPYNSLDPRFTVKSIIAEGLMNFISGREKAKIPDLINDILDKVGLPADSVSRYPHEFSGGQRQRISIARSVVLNPSLLILDEPVSSLDVSVQGQIINLLLTLQEEFSLSYLFIAHDLNVIRRVSDEVCVMYLGKVMEQGEVEMVYSSCAHPYTEALLSAVPVLGQKTRRIILQGEVPSPVSPPSGCRFHTRCPYVQDKCRREEPQLIERRGRLCACHFPR